MRVHGDQFWYRNEATYKPLEKAWGVRIVRPLAIETTRFDSICVGCMLVVVGGGMSGSEQCGISIFPLRRLRVPASRDFPQISKRKLGLFTVITQPTTALSFLPLIYLLPFSSCKLMKMGGQFALLDLPVEIICHILSFVSYRDLTHSTLVLLP